MSLLLTIVSSPPTVSLAESSKTFDVNGGTLGRGNDNTWVLDDPERFLSSLHCQISGENGQYFITDLSTNGTFFNGAAEPMGKGCKLPLNDGDKFAVGDYEFSVSLWSPSQPSMAAPASQSDDLFDAQVAPGSTPSGSDPFFSGQTDGFDTEAAPIADDSLFGGGYVPDSESLFDVGREETDPLAALDKAQGTSSLDGSSLSDPYSSSSNDPFTTLSGESGLSNPPASDPFSGPTHSDEADALNQQVTWPDSSPESGGNVIPDDWDDDLLSSPGMPAEQSPAPLVTPSSPQSPEVMDEVVIPESGSQSSVVGDESATIQYTNSTEELPAQASIPSVEGDETRHVAIEKANQKIEAELELLKRQIQSQKNSVTQDVTVDSSLVDAMGFQGMGLTDEQITEINKKVGEVVRESVKGLMQVLSSRSSIKNEFRMNVTTIQPVENNPLKFSANVDDALENMFVKEGNAYISPVDAVREGFDGVAEHQVAIIAGIRAAFKGVIERFDPSVLEERFSKQNKGGLIPGIQKAKNWDLYTEYFNDLVGDIDSSFQHLFGDEFVDAYEDQLRKLSSARKSKS